MSERCPSAAYSPLGIRLFGRYARRYFGRHFTALRARKGTLPDSLPERCVLYSNHPSWWDPIVLVLLVDSALCNRRVFAPIDAASLERYRILRRIGLFPIDTGSIAGTRRFLSDSDRLLADGHCLAVTAQGRFVDQRYRPTRLRRGVARLLSDGSAQLAIPIAIEYSFWNNRLPEALVSFGSPVTATPGATTDETAERLERALTEELDALESASISRDENRFETIVGRDSSDVDGAYGLLRRLWPGIRRAPEPSRLRPQGR